MPKRKKASCYTVEPGREIYRNGQPFITIHREGETRPVDADRITHVIARALNRRGCPRPPRK